MTTITITCSKGHTAEYTVQDLHVEYDREGVIEDAYVDCKICEEQTEDREAIDLLIEELPEYEPNPDDEFDRMSDNLVEKQLSK